LPEFWNHSRAIALTLALSRKRERGSDTSWLLAGRSSGFPVATRVKGVKSILVAN